MSVPHLESLDQAVTPYFILISVGKDYAKVWFLSLAMLLDAFLEL